MRCKHVKEGFVRILRKKSVTAVLLVCLVALSAVAMWKGSVKNSESKNQYMELEESDQAQVNAKATEGQTTQEELTTEEATTEEVAAKEEVSTKEVVAQENLNFSENTKISWPVEGEVIREFNMEQTIYYPTLNEYKCSSGIVIQSEKGNYVNSPTQCVVTKIGEDEEIGNYVELSLGNDYSIKIGQLDQIAVKVGDTLEEGDHIACTASPTYYYSVEGDNIYLELLKNDDPQDPLLYLN